MKREHLPITSQAERKNESQPRRGAFMVGALAVVTALGIGGVAGKDIFKGEQNVIAHTNDSDKEPTETHLRPVDELLSIQYGEFAAMGDPSLFVDVGQALTVQINSLPGDSLGEQSDTDIQFVVAQLPEGEEPSEDTVFANTFVYDDDGVPTATQTIEQLTGDNGGRFNVTVPISEASGAQHLYIVPMQVGEAMDASELITDNHVDIPFSFDSTGELDLTSIPSRG